MFLAKLSKFVLKRSVIIGTAIFLQFLLLVFLLWKMTSQFVYIYSILTVFSLAAVVYVVGDKTNPAYKLGWTILILAFPALGGIMYLLFGTSKISWSMKKSLTLQKALTHGENFCKENLTELKEADENIYRQLSYAESCGFPVYKNADLTYFPLGEYKFEALKKELKKAQKYILMEYFIISEGKMWSEILEILKEKAAQGVEVRLIYDDCGCNDLPYEYPEHLKKCGINCRVFNPLKPSLSITMNNRDHRKIVVIDGMTGFTGGINLGDEYINARVRHGHWKDCAVMVKGQAVKTFIHLFFEMWNLIKKEDEDITKYYGNYEIPETFDGYIQPYGVEPYNEALGENIYLNMINKAKDEVLIFTPYLIITSELITALTLSARSGVKVTVVTPGIADKWYVHTLTRSYYLQLIQAGVEIYEYTPGFVHGKVVIADGELASVGTINFDYRSLYLHFECGVLIYNSHVIEEIRDDFKKTVSESRLITAEDCNKVPLRTRILRSILRLFAPLM